MTQTLNRVTLVVHGVALEALPSSYWVIEKMFEILGLGLE